MSMERPTSVEVGSDEPAIQIDQLVVRYGRRAAVDGLTLRVPRGSVFGLLGANGAGKTSTIKTLLGFRPPSGGHARLLGYDIAHDRVELNARKQLHGLVRLSSSEPPTDDVLTALRRVPGVGLVEREGRSARGCTATCPRRSTRCRRSRPRRRWIRLI